MSSPYGAGAPSYSTVEVQRQTLEGRLKVAKGIRDASAPNAAEPNARRHAKWAQIVDELLDRLLELRGR